MKAVVAAFNQEKAFSVITNLRMELFQALVFSGAAAGLGAAELLFTDCVNISMKHMSQLGTLHSGTGDQH